jgi:squalene-hopene/tetraprenyl-beta-curcumene cyclase
MLDAPLLQRVKDALLDRRTPAGHWEGHLSSSALATATAVTAIAVASRAGVPAADADRLIDGGVAWLAAHANADGGWGDTPDSVSNISTTALVWAALAFGRGQDVDAAAERAAAWIGRAAGGSDPERLASALAERYGKDRTFSVPILTMCAIAGRLGAAERAWRLIPQLPFELAVLPRRTFGILRLPVVSYALPALISMGIARHRGGAPVPLVSSVRERLANNALAVLTTLQPANGGFLEAVPLTSFVAMSLVAAGESGHPAVRLGLDFLIQSARTDGSWPVDTNLATWVTTLSVNALAGSGSPIEREDTSAYLREWLVGQQWTVEHPYTGAAPGGWAWTNLPGGVPDADDTAGAVLALARLGRGNSRGRHAAADGVRWLLDVQNRDGGIPTFCRGWGTLPFDRSSTDLTAHALRAWSAWLPDLEPALRLRTERGIERGIRFLEGAQRSDGAFVPLWFGNQHAPAEENPLFGTSRVLKGLAAVPDASRPRAGAIAHRAAAWVLEAQNADGGWGGARNVPSSIEETGVAVAALCVTRDAPAAAVKDAVHRGVDYLAGATQGFRTFPTAPIGLYFARLWYSEDVYPVVFTADAVLRAHALLGTGERV